MYCPDCGGSVREGLSAGMSSSIKRYCQCGPYRRSSNSYSSDASSGLVGGSGMGGIRPSEQSSYSYRPRSSNRSRESIYRDVYIAAGLVGSLIVGVIIVCIRVFFF